MDRLAPGPYVHFDPQPALAAPSSSLLRSRSRREVFTDSEINPLLTNLSPSSTLRALAATEAVPVEDRRFWSFIETSVEVASTSERAWGIKASLACKKLLDWHQELSSWPWSYEQPNSFEERPSVSDTEIWEGEEYWGRLATREVQHYEGRVEAIKDDMETLEVEDLKRYVRNTHLVPASRRMSHQPRNLNDKPNYETINDFMAFIIDRIMQALPTLAHLASLLDAWTIRLLILRQTPILLKELDASNEAMVSAWSAINKPTTSDAKRRPDLSRKAFLDLRASLQDHISQLARRVDAMLDLLAGGKDTLPDKWVSKLDDLEDEYSAWVVEAEELVLRTEIENEGNDIESETVSSALRPDIERPTPMMDVGAQFQDIQRRASAEFDRIMGNSSGNVLDGSSDHDSTDDQPEPRTVNEAEMLPKPGIDIFQGGETHEAGAARLAHEDACGNHPSSRSKYDQQSYLRTAHRPLDDPLLAGLIDDPELDPDPKNVLCEGYGHQPASKMPKRSVHRPSPLVLDPPSNAGSTASSDLGSELSSPGSATSDYFSNKSSPEIRDASVVEYLGSPILKSPVWSSKDPINPLDIISRQSSQRTEHGHTKLSQRGSWLELGTPISQQSRASAFVPEPLERDLHGSIKNEHQYPHRPNHHVRARSASMQSFEVVPKSEIRKIMVRRSESYSSPPGTSRFAPTAISQQAQEDSPQDSENKLEEIDKQDSDSLKSLNLLKPRHRFEQVSDLGLGSTPVKTIEKKTNQPYEDDSASSLTTAPASNSSKSVEDQLEARISSILTSIPAHIRLTSGPEPDAPEITRFSPFQSPKTPTSRPPALRFNRTQTSSPTMTLAPAQPKTSKTKSQNGEPEIKLYHLHQAGKDVPIKLFVRLVGEAGERVMVRIGGGWADLAEYLREYATHHGRRAVSDGRFDIQGPSSSPLASQVSPSSRPVTPSSTGTAPAMKRQQITPAGQFDTPHTPASDPSLRPSSRTSWTPEEQDSPSLGLAGPKTKKVDISPRKQAWVDEMLDQARQGGAEQFGDIGKVGATKRVFLKSKTEGQ